MASAIQTIKCIRDEIPQQTKIFLLNTLVLGHLIYPCMLLNCCTEENLDKLESKKLGYTNSHELTHKRLRHTCDVT